MPLSAMQDSLIPVLLAKMKTKSTMKAMRIMVTTEKMKAASIRVASKRIETAHAAIVQRPAENWRPE